jgi:hypothetical protein
MSCNINAMNRKLIRSKATSDVQLSNLLKKLNIDDFAIVRKHMIPHTDADNLIINLDDNGQGSHWVAMSRSKKRYFDSYGQHPPNEVPKSFTHSKKIIEGIHGDDCGQLSVLWLYYINNLDEKSFYDLFDPLYT